MAEEANEDVVLKKYEVAIETGITIGEETSAQGTILELNPEEEATMALLADGSIKEVSEDAE